MKTFSSIEGITSFSYTANQSWLFYIRENFLCSQGKAITVKLTPTVIYLIYHILLSLYPISPILVLSMEVKQGKKRELDISIILITF